MGRLRRLELENFKSYLGVQIIGPFDDFTAVIGPNGAGKSNLMDAISFVLGVQSRHLRSSHLKELIYRRDVNSPPERRASVKLVYEASGGELSGTEEGDEIIFSRTVSASGVSTYRLNGGEVTFQDYEEVLQKIGVLVKARNFLVFQGDVESVASKSPLELSKLIEQICGSDQLQREYEELKQRKETAEENAIFSMQKRKMYVTQRREVKAQKDEAEHFQQQCDALDELQTELVLWQILRLTSEMEVCQENRAEAAKEGDEAAAAESEIERDMVDKKRSLGRLSKQVAASEKECATKEKLLSALAPKLSVAREKLRKLEKRKTDQEKAKGKLEADLAAQEESLEGLRDDIALLEDAEEGLEKQLQDESKTGGLHMGGKELEEYSALREAASARTAKERSESLLLEQEVSSMRARIEELSSQESFARGEREAADGMMSEYRDRLEKLTASLSEGKEDKLALEREKDELLRLTAECEEKGRLLDNQYAEVCGTLQDAGDARRATRQEERLAEALETMQSIFPGVHGRLVDLCRPVQRKYAQAVSVAGGKHMDAIVVDTRQTAADCIRYLKDQRIGRCSFLPLDNISTQDVPDRLRALGGRFRVCADLIDTDSDIFRPAVLYAVGSTVVCDSLEEARELCFTRGERVKVVTLTGHVISKAGTMTGGALVREGGNRWEEKEIERLRKKKVELEEEIGANKRRIPGRQRAIELETRLRTLQTRINLCDADSKVCEEKLAQLVQQEEIRNKHCTALRKERQSVEKECEKKQARLKSLQEEVRVVESEIFGPFSRRMGVENIRDFEETRLRHHKELIARKSEVAEQRASLRAQMEYELKRDFKGALSNHCRRLEGTVREISDVEEEMKRLTVQSEELRVQCEGLVAKREELKKGKKEIETELKTLQSRRNALASEKESALKRVAAQEIAIERLRSQLHETLQKAEVEEIALPAVEGHGEDSELRWRGSTTHSRSSGDSSSNSGGRRRSRRVESQQQESDITPSAHFDESDNPVVARDAERVSTVDLSAIRALPGAHRRDIQMEREGALRRQIQELQEEIESMQPNMHAMERYDGVVEKLKDCNADLDHVRDEAKEITARFDEVRETRQRLFQACFDHVSEALAVIYKDLTRSSKHPLGGNAYLTLDNTEEPFSGGIRYTAMPPSKRFRDMDQLSGGEKTVAALALLFSIHSFRQAPFFVLDEVDAALDNVNVQKVCNYIRQRSKHFQCVVISLKDMFFEHADRLVGVCKDIESVSSRVLTLNLNHYPDSTSSADRGPSESPMAARLSRELGANGDDAESVISEAHVAPSTPSSLATSASPASAAKKRGAERPVRGRGKRRSTRGSMTESIAEEVEED
mmetsp:Transcript_3027/g.4618  ORF Transcript_3027/g.4618 Transcript_3027/m.4618 type:complete len:1350 (+) Transcript_3027:171-4220(+)|eukprot:CAMPEP_0185039470 /NCGR_PEP_ID=MMETSP1103-20130426/36357_1 /TAXON_ID=36769 /ORGANISM="Paraphysomonas bandaiensis, Strain Caron Lab Isolate" /LENGTH=1349 /DNA_ID=CAMNT_0027578367 /DNA_START=82 /DNA_END=4131 /DNA_ORIENTATION=-